MRYSLIAMAVLLSLTGCATTQQKGQVEAPVVTKNMLQKEFDTMPAPASGKPISVAVYSFQDKTGQRRPMANIASLSTAVTQGAETFLIKALQDVGQGRWFDVVERVGIDNLTKERTIIRQMREAYEGPNAKPLMPMQFAGIIIEGGVIGYDSSTKSGGAGARWLGIGASTQYSEDIVTVSIRAVSVQTGKVLAAVTVQKTILSSADSASALKFFDAGTRAFEAEVGLTINEPGTYAVKSATEAAVVELIKEGQRKGVWGYKEEKQNELVQPQTQPAPQPAPVAPAATPPESSNSQSDGTGQGDQVAAADPRELAKKENPTIAVRAEAEVIVAEAKAAAVPAPAAENPAAGIKIHSSVWLTKLSYVYRQADEKSQRTWQLPAGTEFTVKSVQGDWVEVISVIDNRKGWVLVTVLSNTPQLKSK